MDDRTRRIRRRLDDMYENRIDDTLRDFTVFISSYVLVVSTHTLQLSLNVKST